MANAESTETLEQLGARSLLNCFAPVGKLAEKGPHVMVQGKGCRVIDNDGKEYLDALAGIWCVNVGYGREEIAEAISRQAKRLCYYHSFWGSANEPGVLLADKLRGLVPMDNARVFFGNSGSDANDTQIKLVWYYNNLMGRPEKKKIIARHGGYHGVTVATSALSGLPMLKAGFDIPFDQFRWLEKPHHYFNAPEGMSEEDYSSKLAADLEEMIEKEGPDTIAAFIAEPVQGACGVIVPPAGYFEKIVPILKKHDILFIADEVVSGFGRLGKWFGSEFYGFRPDLMTVAKGLTSAYLPMSATIVSEKVWSVIAQETAEKNIFGHGYTYSAHPVSAAAALANIEIIENDGLVDRSAEMGAYMQPLLRKELADHPLVGEVRGTGMIAAFEMVADKAKKTPFDPSVNSAARLQKYLREDGLICRAVMNITAFSPPLVIEKSDIDELVSKLKSGLDKLQDELVKSGDWKG